VILASGPLRRHGASSDLYRRVFIALTPQAWTSIDVLFIADLAKHCTPWKDLKE